MSNLTFSYDGQKLNLTVEIEQEKVLHVMEAVKTALETPTPRRSMPRPGGPSDHILKFLRDNPDSRWAEIRRSLEEAGLGTSQAMLINLVNSGCVIKTGHGHGMGTYRLAENELAVLLGDRGRFLFAQSDTQEEEPHRSN